MLHPSLGGWLHEMFGSRSILTIIGSFSMGCSWYSNCFAFHQVPSFAKSTHFLENSTSTAVPLLAPLLVCDTTEIVGPSHQNVILLTFCFKLNFKSVFLSLFLSSKQKNHTIDRKSSPWVENYWHKNFLSS